jgi:hypothetical protein
LREKQRLKVFKNWVLRQIFGPTKDGVIWEWKKIEKYFKQNIIPVLKSRRMSWAGHVARKSIHGFGGKT